MPLGLSICLDIDSCKSRAKKATKNQDAVTVKWHEIYKSGSHSFYTLTSKTSIPA